MTKLKKTYCILSLIFAIAVFVAVLFASQNRTTVYAASMDPDSIDSLDNTAANTSTGSGSESDSKGGLSISINNDEAGVASEVRALLLLTIIAVSPSLLIMLTSYTRIVIVLHFLRTAIGTQTAPPNQILIGLALFLTFFIMWPTFQQINENAIQPLDNGDITIEKALKEASLTPVALMEKKRKCRFASLCMDRYSERMSSFSWIWLVTVMILTVLHWKRNMRNPGRVHMMRFR